MYNLYTKHAYYMFLTSPPEDNNPPEDFRLPLCWHFLPLKSSFLTRPPVLELLPGLQ
jgi:hypothetical protein